jgi:hypothetical protein
MRVFCALHPTPQMRYEEALRLLRRLSIETRDNPRWTTTATMMWSGLPRKRSFI